MIPGLILAGGLARRMGGGDKSLQLLGSESVLQHVINKLQPQVDVMLLNANGDPARFVGYGLPVLADSLPDYPGPLAGILAGLDWAAEQGAQSLISVAADTPFFPPDLVARLLAAASPSGLALAATPDPKRGMMRHPTFGLWPVALRHDLRAALTGGLRKIVAWTDQHGAGIAEFAATPYDPFFNINTPQDMALAEDILKMRA